jgi:ferredoxin
MIYHVIINQDCLGFGRCRQCEAVEPGIAYHIDKHGKVIASEYFVELNRSRIERLIQCCPKSAISIKKVE